MRLLANEVDQMRYMMSADMLFRAGIFGAVVSLGLGSQTLAQVPKSVAPGPPPAKLESPGSIDAEPNSTEASFGDWILRCQRLGNGAETQHLCEVAQQIRAQDQQNPVAELAIGHLKKDDAERMPVVLPVKITFSTPPSFSTDGKVAEPLELGWRKGWPGGCIAHALLKDG